MIKQFYRRVEGPHKDGMWQRHVNQYADEIIGLDFQDNGDTLKMFKYKALYITVELHNNVKCFVGKTEIKFPTYLAPDGVKVGGIVTVPIGSKRFNRATVKEIVAEPTFMVRAIDTMERK